MKVNKFNKIGFYFGNVVEVEQNKVKHLKELNRMFKQRYHRNLFRFSLLLSYFSWPFVLIPAGKNLLIPRVRFEV